MANGINTVNLNGEVKHITELDDLSLCNEWTKIKEENHHLLKLTEKQTEDGEVLY